MKIKDTFYTSYKTHNYCAKESRWILKELSAGKFCTCGWRLRKNPRFTGAKADRWINAY